MASALLSPPSMANQARKRSRRHRSSSKRAGKSKRELLKSRIVTFFTRRTSRGQFREMDERGRSLTADRRRKAKRRSSSGQGDRGDRRAA